MPSEDVKELDPSLLILRKDNVKTYPCKKCGKSYPSRQALYYHQKLAVNPCCPDDAEEDPATHEQDPATLPEQKKKFVEIAPAVWGASSEQMDGGESPETLDGNTPPIPLALLLIIVFVLAVLGLILFFWDTLYKFARKHLGGEPDGRISE